MRQAFVSLQATVDERTRSTLASHPDWPCRKGCDGCCRSLAAIPVLTEAEWVMVRDAIAACTEHERMVIGQRILALRPGARPVVCPLLRPETGSCAVYSARPLACRTYGFYVDREGGLYCALVEQAMSARKDIVWGNQEAIDARLDTLGPRLPLTAWFARDRR